MVLGDIRWLDLSVEDGIITCLKRQVQNAECLQTQSPPSLIRNSLNRGFVSLAITFYASDFQRAKHYLKHLQTLLHQRFNFQTEAQSWTSISQNCLGFLIKYRSIDQKRIPLIAQKVGRNKMSIHGDLTSFAQLLEVLEYFEWFWGGSTCFKVGRDW